MIKKLALLPLLLLAACAVPMTQPPQPTSAPTTDPSATPVSATAPTPTPETSSEGTISGRVCYPSEFIPAMSAYFLEVGSNKYTELPIAENQESYEITVPAGSYVAFAWWPEASLGGGYTPVVPCGYAESCTDRSLLEFTVAPGERTPGIDLCDWPLDGLPLPSGVAAPSTSAGFDLSGMMYSDAAGLWRISAFGAPERLLDKPGAQPAGPDRILFAEADDIWLYNLATGETRNLTATPDRIENLWSGRAHPQNAVLFTSYPVDFELGPGVSGFLTSAALDGTGYTVLDSDNQSSWFDVSPDGARVAYGMGSAGLVLDLETGGVELFVPAEYGMEKVQSIGSPAWSPDGSKISWIVGFQEFAGEPFVFGVGVFDLAARTSVVLHPYNLPGMDGFPPPAAWRPDGEWLAVQIFDIDFDRSGIWLLRADGAVEMRIGQGGNLAWRPDGNLLVYTDGLAGGLAAFDTIALQSTALDIFDKTAQPVGWLP